MTLEPRMLDIEHMTLCQMAVDGHRSVHATLDESKGVGLAAERTYDIGFKWRWVVTEPCICLNHRIVRNLG